MPVTQDWNLRPAGWFVFVAVTAFCLWVPAALGSNRPYIWAINGTILSGIAVLTLLGLPLSHQRGWRSLRIGQGLFSLLILWIGGSAVLGEAFSGVAWNSRASVSALLYDVRALASYSQTDSTLILIALVSHSLLWWVVVQLVQHGFGRFLYWSILCVVTGHALLGLIGGGGEASLLKPLGQTQTGDVGSGFVNRNHFASYLGLGAVLAVALALRNARQMTYEGVRSSVVLRVFLSSAALMLITLALLSTQSRMGLAASATGVLAVILLHGFVCRAWGVTVTFMLLYVLAVNLAVFFTVDVLERFVVADMDFQTRLGIYRQALELWQIRPWTGFGAGSFETVFATIRDGQFMSDIMITRAHNSYITLLVEMGLVGSFIVLSLFIWLIIEQTRALGRSHYFAGLVGLACLVVLGMHAVLDFGAEIYAVMSLLVLMLAMSTGFNQRRRQQSFASEASAPSLMKLTGSAELRTTQVLLYPKPKKHGS